MGISTLACGVVAASEVWAAGGSAEHGSNLGLLFLQVLNTAVLAFILVRYAGPPLRSFLVQRSQGIRRRIEASEARLRQARAELEELRRRLERFEREAQEIVSESAATAANERVRLLERAAATAERIREEARRVADQEIARARRELQEEAAELAVTLAREILREKLTSQDDNRLVAEYVDHLGASE